MIRSNFPPVAPEMLTTEELADSLRCATQTIRKNVSQQGHHNGIKPIKLPNGRLLFRKKGRDALLGVGA